MSSASGERSQGGYDNRPTVFVSSTVEDFRDMRSALSYFLEANGYRVLLSETPEFPVPGDRSNTEVCLDAVDMCNYYILFVGDRRGSWHKVGASTITLEEYRRARQRYERGDNIRILVFIRRATWSAISNMRKPHATAPLVEDPAFTSAFIDEIIRKEETVQAQAASGEMPKGAWIWTFDRFAEIADVLSVTMRTNTNRQLELLRGMAIDELEVIVRSCFEDYTRDGRPFPAFMPLQCITRAQRRSGIMVPMSLLHDIAVLGTFGWKLNWIPSLSLERLLFSGELLKYDSDAKTFRPSSLMRVLRVLLAEVNRVRDYFRNENVGRWFRRLQEVEDMADETRTTFTLPDDVAGHLWMNARTERIFYNAYVALQALKSSDPVVTVENMGLSDDFFTFVAMSGKSLDPPPMEQVDEWFTHFATGPSEESGCSHGVAARRDA